MYLRKHLNKSLFLAALAVFCISIAHTPLTLAQETVYVSDVLVVNFRAGQGNQYRIDKRLKSGTALTLLERSEDGNWAKVTLSDGTEGYVLTQYLVSEKTARLKLADAERELAAAKKELIEIKNQHSSLSKNHNEISSESSRLAKENDRLKIELRDIKALSAGALEQNDLYNKLQVDYQLIQTERDSLRAENERLKQDQSLSFMIYGAALVLLGVIIAIIAPYLKRKKRNSEWA